jgi:hypothetical protein
MGTTPVRGFFRRKLLDTHYDCRQIGPVTLCVYLSSRTAGVLRILDQARSKGLEPMLEDGRISSEAPEEPTDLDPMANTINDDPFVP